MIWDTNESMGGFGSVAADGGKEDISARKNGRGLDAKQTQTEEDEKREAKILSLPGRRRSSLLRDFT